MKNHDLVYWVACAALAVVLALGAFVRWRTPAQVADLAPRPDALEYEEAARNLARGQGYSLIVDGGKYPPRYPFGFPLLLVPLFLVFGGQVPGIGIWCVLVCALLAIVATWRLASISYDPLPAVAAALLVALSPLHVECSRMVMSDVPASAALAGLGVWTLAILGREAPAWELLCLGLASGMAATIRLSNVLVVPLLALALALLPPDEVGLPESARLAPDGLLARRLGARGLRTAPFLAGTALGAAPLLSYNVIRFGSPLRNGYDLWHAAEFGWRFIAEPGFGGSGERGNLVYYLGVVTGAGDLYPWPVAVLVLVGSVIALGRGGRLRALAFLGLGVTAALVAFQSFFFWQSERFLVPTLPFLAALAAVPIAVPAKRVVRLAAIGLLVIALVLAVRSQALQSSRFLGSEVANLREIDRVAEPNAAILVATNSFLFDRVLRHGTDRLWLPLVYCKYRLDIRRYDLRPYARAAAEGGWLRDVTSDPERAETVIRRLLREGRPIYFSGVDSPVAMTVLLGSRFRLEGVAGTRRMKLFRVRAKAAPGQ